LGGHAALEDKNAIFSKRNTAAKNRRNTQRLPEPEGRGKFEKMATKTSLFLKSVGKPERGEEHRGKIWKKIKGIH